MTVAPVPAVPAPAEWAGHVPTHRPALVVSLEAIFLSTFVMIGQNRQASFQQAKADHDFTTNEQELRINTELTKTIHQLTQELHAQICQGHTPSS